MKTLHEFFRQPRVILLTILTFFLSAVLVGVIVNLISSLLEMQFGYTPQRLFILVISIILATLFLYGVILRLRRETHLWMPLPSEMQAQPHPGLVALVGPGTKKKYLEKPEDSPAAAAIRYHLEKGALKFVWLIASDEGVPVAEALRNLYGDRATIRLTLPPIRNILDIPETFEAACQITKELPDQGLRPEDVVADYTGGTSSMSVGLALAAVRSGYSMEFMSQQEGSASVPLQTGLLGSWRISRQRKS